MVKLVPSFLRNIINLATDIEEDEETKKNSVRYQTEYLSEMIKYDEDMINYDVTTNITTVASTDWGYPKLSDKTILDDIGLSSKHLFDIFTDSGSFDNEANEESGKTLKIPRVEESDFLVYMNQLGDLNDEGDVVVYPQIPTNEDDVNVSNEYFREDYALHSNKIFNLELDKIPDSISELESQLMVINAQLRDLLGTHLKDVNESLLCIEELKDPFACASRHVAQIRTIFTLIRSASFSDLSAETTKGDIADPETQVSDIIERKKCIQTMLGYLQVLRAVSATPDCIQGIVELNNLALARIFGTCLIDYFRNELSRFSLVQSISYVIEDNLETIERVCEAKFIDLSIFALVESFNDVDFNEHVLPIVDKLEPSLIVLRISNCLAEPLDTLLYTRKDIDFSKFTDLDYGIRLILNGIKLSFLWVGLISRKFVCIDLLFKGDNYTPPPEISKQIVQKMLYVIQDGLMSSKCRNYSNMTKTILLLKNTFQPLNTCTMLHDYTAYFEDFKYGNEHMSPPTTSHCCITSGDHSRHVVESPLHSSTSESLVDGGKVNVPHEETCSQGGDDKDAVQTNDVDTVLILSKLLGIVEDMILKSMEIYVDGMSNHAYDFSSADYLDDFKKSIDKLSQRKINFELFQQEFVNLYKKCHNFIINNISEEYKPINHQIYDNCTLTAINECLKLNSELPLKIETLFVNNIVVDGKVLIEMFYAEWLNRTHKNFLQEDWVDCKNYGTDADFCLIKSVAELHEILQEYIGACRMFPQLGGLVISRCINIFTYFNTLLEAEIQQDYNIVKLALISEVLRFFTLIIPRTIKTATSIFKREDDEEIPHELLIEIGSNAENCILDGKNLHEKVLRNMIKIVHDNIKEPVLMWLQSESDVGEDEHSILKIISVMNSDFNDVSNVIHDDEMLKHVFKSAFDDIVDLVTGLSINKHHRFSDDCSKIITNLSHCSSIKLEIFAFADALANELSN